MLNEWIRKKVPFKAWSCTLHNDFILLKSEFIEKRKKISYLVEPPPPECHVLFEWPLLSMCVDSLLSISVSLSSKLKQTKFKLFLSLQMHLVSVVIFSISVGIHLKVMNIFLWKIGYAKLFQRCRLFLSFKNKNREKQLNLLKLLRREK